MQPTPRQKIGTSLGGDVLEIGPGNNPFPTAPDASVRFADRSVSGGRDTNWPELAGSLSGPNAHFDINLDLDGLSAIADETFDAVIASHVIEHLAAPIKAIQEFERVLRPGGRLVLIVPDRLFTFDSIREPTTLSHLLSEFQEGVVEVSDEHIAEFCSAIFAQPPIHPPEVRDWYDPEKLDSSRYSLHRRRSIHVHCWAPEEFAALIAGLLAHKLTSFKLRDLYFVDDSPESGEFGLVLERSDSQNCPEALSIQFVEDWITGVFSNPRRDIRRARKFLDTLYRDLHEMEPLRDAAFGSITRLVATSFNQQEKIRELERSVMQRDADIDVITRSRSWRVTAPLRKLLSAARRPN